MISRKAGKKCISVSLHGQCFGKVPAESCRSTHYHKGGIFHAVRNNRQYDAGSGGYF